MAAVAVAAARAYERASERGGGDLGLAVRSAAPSGLGGAGRGGSRAWRCGVRAAGADLAVWGAGPERRGSAFAGLAWRRRRLGRDPAARGRASRGVLATAPRTAAARPRPGVGTLGFTPSGTLPWHGASRGQGRAGAGSAGPGLERDWGPGVGSGSSRDTAGGPLSRAGEHSVAPAHEGALGPPAGSMGVLRELGCGPRSTSLLSHVWLAEK